MSRRSWMAVLAVATGLLGTELAAPPRPARADEPPVEGTVSLQLQITGLTAGESIIEIKPGHPACTFKPITRRVRAAAGGGMVRLEPIRIDARSLGADRDCSFAITIREPGQPPQTFRRGIRLTPPSGGVEVASRPQTLKLYLSAPSVATRDLDSGPRRR